MTVFTDRDKVFDWTRQRVTDVKGNSKVVLPRPLSPNEEAKLAVLRVEWNDIFDRFVRETCKEAGEQASNLTTKERKGLKMLRKRVSDGELVVLQTDKSGRFAVMRMETYIKAGEVHTGKDREVGWQEITSNQSRLNGHVSMWLKIFRAGQRWKHEDRMRESMINHSMAVCPSTSFTRTTRVDPGKEELPLLVGQ